MADELTLARSGARPADWGGPLVLIVMDGVGIGLGDEYDAVHTARTPNLDSLSESGIHRSIFAHGPYVGLSSLSDMGNSEVGHNTLGAGRIFDQGSRRIDLALISGSIWEGIWKSILEATSGAGNNATLHLIGLLSDGNIHSSIDQLFALLNHAATSGVKRLRIHTLLDGRDVPDRSADRYINQLEEALADLNAGHGVDYKIASGGGRMVTTMDRYEADWRIVQRGWNAHVLGLGRPFGSANEAIATLRKESPGISDQLLDAFVVTDSAGSPIGPVEDGDTVVIFNFRGDRVMQLSRAFVEDDSFSGFDRVRKPDVLFAGMTLYDGDTNMPPLRLVEPEPIAGTISEFLAHNDIPQFACSETQKYGHMTYFWNGNRSDMFDPETEVYDEVSSDQVPFDQRPWMKSAQTADAILERLRRAQSVFLRSNLAGGDMVGHTGNFEATVLAVESVDLAIGRIARQVQAAGGVLVITADHGNAEDMVERDSAGHPELLHNGTPRWKTAHSTNPIPLTIADWSGVEWAFRDNQPKAGLANVAATLLDLLGFSPPPDYEPSLITRL